MYSIRNFASSVKKKFDPNLNFGFEGLILSLPLMATGSMTYIAANLHLLFSHETLETSQQILPKLGLYGGAATTIAGAAFLVDDLFFNSSLLSYIIKKI